MKNKKTLSLILLVCLVVNFLPFVTILASAGENNIEGQYVVNTIDAMPAIISTLSEYIVEATVNLDEDGYIGIPISYTVLYDTAYGSVTAGYDATPIIIYVINTNTERVGTDSDVNIIGSMLNRGYAVIVVDYKNHIKSTSPAIEYSLQALRARVKNRELFTSPIFPSGTYYNNYVVPAGYDISLSNVFWEMDKHSADGTLEKIVEIWNNDFKGAKANKLVKWVKVDGTRKETTVASDGTSPMWYDSKGNTNENGDYTYVKWTVANDITDCVNPDGSPLDLDLTMYVIYPTSPEKEVPVMTLASSSENMESATSTADRPHFNGFLFNGYAGVVYDYLWVPMARTETFGYYDGKSTGAVSGDASGYSVYHYNDKLVATAIMRYIRYLSLSNGDTYNFDINAIGIFGNSKGGAIHFFGESAIQTPTVKNSEAYSSVSELEAAINAKITALAPNRYLEGHHGETRYEAGKLDSYSANNYTGKHQIDGGELQPWLTYNGVEIISGAQLVYASNGASLESITPGYSPLIVVAHLADSYNSAYTSMNTVVNLAHSMDVPTLFFEVPLGHTFAYGKDLNYGTDTYRAIFDFAGFYLKGDAVKIIYTAPANGGSLAPTEKITIKFSGEVSADEIEKILIKSTDGSLINGSWSSDWGNTEWNFTPSNIIGGDKYTVTVPTGFSGENGTSTTAEQNFEIYTTVEAAYTPDGRVAGTRGEYITVTVPALAKDVSNYVLRFRVTNDAANTASVYIVNGFNASNPDASSLGEKIASIPLKGIGYYEADVTKYIAENFGKTVTFLISAEKKAGQSVKINTFDSGLSGFTAKNYVTMSGAATPGGDSADKSLMLVVKPNEGQYTNSTFYRNLTESFTYNGLIKSGGIEEGDYGRKFTVSVEVYDEISRVIEFKLAPCTHQASDVIDYQAPIYHFVTEAGNWTTFTFDYTVYDKEYGARGIGRWKTLTVSVAASGSTEIPVYFNNMTVTETVTDITLGDVGIVGINNGGAAYKADSASNPFTLVADGVTIATYLGWKQVLSAYRPGQTILLNANYTLTDADVFGGYTTLGDVVIDLNGYTINCQNTANSLLWVRFDATSAAKKVTVTVKNGGILLNNAPLVSFEDSVGGGVCTAVDLNLEGVNISLGSQTKMRDIITATTSPDSASGSVNISFEECNLSFTDDKIPYNSVCLIPTVSGGVKVKYDFVGGSIVLTSQRWVTVQEAVSLSAFHPDANGNYTTLVLETGNLPASSAYVTDGGHANYANGTANGGFTTYTFKTSSISTPYGMISEKYADADTYPFLAFQNGELIDLGTGVDYNIFAKDTSGTMERKLRDKKSGDTIYIVARKNFTVLSGGSLLTNYQTSPIVIDLMGYTVDASAANHLFESNGTQALNNVITVKNGSIILGKSLMTVANKPSVEGRTQTFNFENLNITSTYKELITYNGNNIKIAGKLFINFTDCDISSTNLTNHVYRASQGSGSDNLLKIEITVNGGSTTLSSFTQSKFVQEFSDGLVTFLPNANGEMHRVVLNKGTSVDTTTAYHGANGAALYMLKDDTLTAADEYVIDCPHTYDTDCDADCNYCGAVRAVNHIGGSATCTEKAKCDICGTEYGDLAQHIPNADDGDCTTDITCTACGTVTTPGAESHTGGAASCTDKAKCETCGTQYGNLAQHDYSKATCVSKSKCSVCGDEIGDLLEHKDNDNDGKCDACSISLVESTPDQTNDADGLSGGAIAGIIIVVVAVVCIGAFVFVWFVIKKKTIADFFSRK